jgi:cell division cycle protein 37
MWQVTPWNVDTISRSGFTKTVINTAPRRQEENLTEEQQEQRMKKFVKENEKSLKKFGMLRHFDDSKQFLQENQHLVCEDTANYLVIWCINLEMEGVCLIPSSLNEHTSSTEAYCLSKHFLATILS